MSFGNRGDSMLTGSFSVRVIIPVRLEATAEGKRYVTFGSVGVPVTFTGTEITEPPKIVPMTGVWKLSIAKLRHYKDFFHMSPQ